MSEGITESLVHNIMDTISEDEDSGSVSSKLNSCRRPPMEEQEDLRRRLRRATIVWVLFEWLNYNLLPLVCFALIIGLLVQFLWTNASGLLNRSSSSSSSSPPRLILPEEVFLNTGKLIGSEVNCRLSYLQEVACAGTMKQFLTVVGSLLAAAIVGSWCNFLTVIYLGFVAAHTLPVVYEKYEDEIDNVVLNVTGQVQHNYKKLDTSVLSRIPRAGSFRYRGKKADYMKSATLHFTVNM